MKKLFLLVAAVAMLLPSCKKINESIDGLDGRLDKLEQESIPTIDEQNSAINTTIGDLDAINKELNGYIDNLIAVASSLQEQINATDIKIEDLNKALQGEITTAEVDVLKQLNIAKTKLGNELAQINKTIEILQEKDIELDNKIAELGLYVDNKPTSTDNWVNVTFATLEQHNALVAEAATIKEQIRVINQSITDLEISLTTTIKEDIANALSFLDADIRLTVSGIITDYTSAVKIAREEVTAAHTTAIQTAIVSLDNSLKTWVGEPLSNYCALAEVDAKILALQNSIAIKKGDAALQAQVDLLKKDLPTMKSELIAAYQKAIQDAITTNNGVIDTKIANEIATINQRIDSEVATINAKISKIEALLDNVETEAAELLVGIQSVSYIPAYDDGKATIKYAEDISRITLDFEVSPKDVIAKLANVWQRAVSIKAVYTQTRAVSFIDMPIVNFESDVANGTISITASGENLSAEFFNGTQSASVRLSISDGNNSVTSEYISMVAKEVTAKELGVIPNKEIWYTSSDGNVVAPYDAGAFGANIVSNTYEDGLGVIRFDAPINSIGKDAFKDCASLTSITAPYSVTSIGDSAFYGCATLTSTVLPNTVTTIGKEAFKNCSSLKNIPLGNSLSTIGDFAFSHCSSLESITISESIETVGKQAFENCCGEIIINSSKIVTTDYQSDNAPFTSPDGWLYGSKFTELVIGDSVTKVGAYAFAGSVTLNSITIGSRVTTLGNCAFLSCKGALIINSKIVATDYQSDGAPFTSPDGWLYGSEFTELVIGDNVTKVGDYALVGCSTLHKVTIGPKVQSIGIEAFRGCTSLTSITIGNSVTTIGEHAFAECTSLEGLIIPNNVASIGNEAFAACSSLASVTIGNGVTTIGSCAFSSCKGVLIINSKIVATDYQSDGAPFTSPDGWLYGSEFTELVIGDNVTKVGDYAFAGCVTLNSITIGSRVTTIGSCAFSSCKGKLIINGRVLATDYQSNNAPFLSPNGWLYGSEFTELVIGDSVTKVGDYVFADCVTLNSITIGSSVMAIGSCAFSSCKGELTINSRELVESNYSYAPFTAPNGWLYGSKFTELVISDSVTTVGDYIFACCNTLQKVTIGHSVESIGKYAFAYCTSLTSVTIENSIATIGEHAFAECTSLERIIIPSSVTSIGDGAFAVCSSLKEVYCRPTTPPSIGMGIFYGNASKRKIYTPRNSVETYKLAEGWSDYASDIVGYDF